MTWSPRMMSSPTSPVGTGSPCSSSIHTSVPGIATPTEPGADVELLGRQVADALALGLPVHREQHGVVEDLAHGRDARDRERRAGVREQPQVRQIALGETVEVDEHLPDRRHAGEDRDLLVDDRLHHPARERHAALEHDRRAHAHGHDQVVEPVGVREREDAQDAVLAAQAEVLDDRVGHEAHVPVQERDALGQAGRARRVDDRRQVDVHRLRIGTRHVDGRLDQLLERRRVPDAAADADDVQQLRRAQGGVLDEVGVARVAHGHLRSRVLEEVGELLLLGGRVQRRERRAGTHGAVDRDRRLHAVGEHDGDAITAPHAELPQAGREPVDRTVELGVRQPPISVDDGRAIGAARRAGAQIVGEGPGVHDYAFLPSM